MTTITVDTETMLKLNKIKYENGFKTLDAVIEDLIKKNGGKKKC